MNYWVYDGGDTESYTNVHCSRMLMLEHVPCYQDGDTSYWHGPYETRDEADQKALEIGRVEQRDHTRLCRY